MKTLFITLFFLPTLLLAQEFEFQQEVDTIPVEIDGWQPFSPWTGGEDESAPDLCDIDADGDMDFFIGNYSGRLSYYKNQGNQTLPFFDFMTKEYADIELGGPTYAGRTSPEFCDIDGDGDYDLFSGDFRGLIHYWENVGSAQSPEFEHVTDSLAFIDMDGYSKFEFRDMDSDGDYDIILGDYFGLLWYFENIGTASNFTFLNTPEQFENMDMGYNACPSLVDIDNDNDYDLFIGEEEGTIWFYENTGDSVNYSFPTGISNWLGIDVGDYSSPEFADIDGDGDYDLFVGRDPSWPEAGAGDVFFYENIGSPELYDFEFRTSNYLSLDEGFLTHVDLVDIDDDGDSDLFITALDILRFYRNVGTPLDPSFVRELDEFPNISGDDITPFFCDLDNDGDLDLVCGNSAIPGPPELQFYTNEGTPQEPQFALSSTMPVGGNFSVILYPSLADINADGDLDLFVCDQNEHLFYYENTGSPEHANFTWRSDNWQGISCFGMQRSSRFWDLDHDGDLDLLLDDPYDLTVLFYRNTGTPNNPNMVLQPSGTIAGLNWPNDGSFAMGLDIVDIDQDGDGDFFSGTVNGGAFFFRNLEYNSISPPNLQLHPHHGTEFRMGPNPANPITWVSFNLTYSQKAELAVYNLLGQRVATLAQGYQMPGTQTLYWNVSDFSSGVYLIKLLTENAQAVQKLVIMK